MASHILSFLRSCSSLGGFNNKHIRNHAYPAIGGHNTKVAPVSASSERHKKTVRFFVCQSTCPSSYLAYELVGHTGDLANLNTAILK